MKSPKTNLYVFEPCEWEYCGGAILVIAKTFEQAIKLAAKSEVMEGSEFFGLFSKNEQELKERNGSCNQWLLTHKFQISDTGEPRVLVNNYNFA